MGVLIYTQIGHTGPQMPSEVGRPIYLYQVALEFPELTIVGGHIGYPWTDEAIAVGTKHRDVHIDTSAYTVDRYPPQLVDYLKHHGSQKVLFGSNYPMITPAKALAGLDSLGLDETTRSYFLEDNARRVYGLEPSVQDGISPQKTPRTDSAAAGAVSVRNTRGPSCNS